MPVQGSIQGGQVIRLAEARPRAMRPPLRESLTAPAFERAGHAAPRLWWLRLVWRARLRALLREREEVLADLGTSGPELADYVARPPWQG